ncbi:MAG: hypothetical protein ACP5TX_05370 [Thermoplasmata archaeon]
MDKKEIEELINEFNSLKNGLKLFLISGEDGLGKTSILKQFCSSIKDQSICYYTEIKEKPEFIQSNVLNDIYNYFKKEVPSIRTGLVEVFSNRISIIN